MVSSRYNSTLPSAASAEIEKNSDPASDTATQVAPAACTVWRRASRPNGWDWSSRPRTEARTIFVTRAIARGSAMSAMVGAGRRREGC